MIMKLTARIFEKMRHGMCLLVVAFVFLLLGSAQAMAQDERILSFDSRIDIREDASLVVTETIRDTHRFKLLRPVDFCTK